MQKTNFKLPPLNALRTFEVSARHLSFTKAAQELCVTQGAVSRQVKLLEEYLGDFLFERRYQSLALTKKAVKYYANIKYALNSICLSTDLIYGNKSDNIFTINVVPSLSGNWLNTHIKYLKKCSPQLKIKVVSGIENKVSFSKINANVVIRIGKKPFNGVKNKLLMNEEMVLIASPALISKEIKNLHDIGKYIFLDNSTRPSISKNWMKSVNMNSKNIEFISFEHFFMIIEAAEQGMGFGLVPKFLVKNKLQKGLLINPFGIHYKTGFSYYLLYSDLDKNKYKIIEFGEYLHEQCQKD